MLQLQKEKQNSLLLLASPPPADFTFLAPIFLYLGRCPSRLRVKNVMTLKCSLAFLQKQPAISLTEKYYIDNIESIQLEWNNISNIWVLQYRDSFLKISVVDDSVVYRQAKNRIWKYIFKKQERNKGILSVNSNFLKGKSIDVVNLIKDYQQSVLRNGR